MGFGLKIGMLKHAHEPEMLFFVHYRKELLLFWVGDGQTNREEHSPSRHGGGDHARFVDALVAQVVQGNLQASMPRYCNPHGWGMGDIAFETTPHASPFVEHPASRNPRFLQFQWKAHQYCCVGYA